MLWLEGPTGDARTVLGPAGSFRALGASLRIGGRDKEVASLRNGRWHTPGARPTFYCLWTEALSSVRFDNPESGESRLCGPVDMIGVIDGVIHVDRELSRPLARFDQRSGHWQSCDDGQLWPIVTFLPLPRPLAVAVSHEPARSRSRARAS